ncbi:MAG TPA: hypothetical protein VJV03_07685 [Pyrinomonadaceae bacterium]|nr:hypothetical protein [Pyrinomonadaceae bacterium]
MSEQKERRGSLIGEVLATDSLAFRVTAPANIFHSAVLCIGTAITTIITA